MTLSEQGRDITSIPKPLDIISITYRVQLLFCYCSRMVVKTSSYEVCSISNRKGYTLSLSAPECSMMSSTDTSESPLASMKALIRWTSRDLLSGCDMIFIIEVKITVFLCFCPLYPSACDNGGETGKILAEQPIYKNPYT